MTSPEVERAVFSIDLVCTVGWEALESSSAVLQTAARPSQLPARIIRLGTQKKPDVLRDTEPRNKRLRNLGSQSGIRHPQRDRRADHVGSQITFVATEVAWLACEHWMISLLLLLRRV